MVNRMFPKLFERGQIGKLELSDRIIKAATHTHLGAIDGSVTDRMLRFYEQVARGGTALVTVQMCRVYSQEKTMLLGLDNNFFIPGLSALVQAIHDNGAKAGVQLVHVGWHGVVPPIKCVSLGGPPDELEAIRRRGVPMPQEYTIADIQELIAAYGDAARRAQQAGFDLVEVHAAHGHGITQFLSPRTNRRTDWYGGSSENRMRFLIETIADVRKKVGSDFPISVRLSGTEYYPDGIMIEETLEVAKALEKADADVIHMSGGVALSPAGHHTTATMGMPLANNLWAAEAVKKVVHIPVIASGSISIPELAEEILEKGKADFIALARPLFADPYWPKKAKEGRSEDITPCIRCNDGCQERTDWQQRQLMCTVNVTLGKETRLPLIPAARPKNVAIIGGGPGGMEAARICALRGHKVTLYEKRELGGALIEASVPEFKADLRRLIKYYVTQMEKLKVEVIHKEAKVNTIKDGKFDAVIVAVGAAPMKPDIPGVDKPIVTDVLEVLRGRARPGKRVCVVGGGVIGVEVGLFLAEQGKEITFTTRQNELMTNVVYFDQLVYQEMLSKQKVIVYIGRHLEAVLDNGLIVTDANYSRQEIRADSVVLASGFTPRTALRDQLEKETVLDLYAVGDCVSPRRIFDAVHEGHLAANNI